MMTETRDRILFALAAVCAVLLSYNFYKIFLVLPDEANQGAIYRIVYVHVPSIFTGFTGFFVALAASGAYLATGKLKYDAFAAAVTEVSLAFATIVLATGMIWGRIIWGVWWAWDARLTTMLVCWLIYAGYLMLRRAIDEPTQRARLSAVVSIFGCVDILIVWKSIEWWRTQHPRASPQRSRRRRHGPRNGSAHLLELAGLHVSSGHSSNGPNPPRRTLARNRFPPPHGPLLLK